MTGKILYCLRIYSGMNQVSDISVPQLVRCDLEIQTINDIFPVHAFLSGFWLEFLLDSLAINILVQCPFLRSPDSDIVPYPVELRVG